MALAKGLDTLKSCFDEVASDPEARKKPEVIHAIAGALRILTEVRITEKVITARLNAAGNSTRFPNVSRYPN
jgi:hypothetical protein